MAKHGIKQPGKYRHHADRPATGAERHKRWREANPEKRRVHGASSARKNRAEKGHYILAYKEAYGCQDCDEGDVVVLDLHHIEPKDERLATHRLALRSLSWDDLRKEIARCVVVCANCHRRRHA